MRMKMLLAVVIAFGIVLCAGCSSVRLQVGSPAIRRTTQPIRTIGPLDRHQARKAISIQFTRSF